MSSQCSNDDDAYDSDEPPELELDLAKLMEHATRALSATCFSARRITRGTGHEIFTLEFLPAPATDLTDEPPVRSTFSCIARFARVKDTAITAKEQSEIATILYLQENTSIPVPQILYHDLDPKNDV